MAYQFFNTEEDKKAFRLHNGRNIPASLVLREVVSTHKIQEQVEVHVPPYIYFLSQTRNSAMGQARPAQPTSPAYSLFAGILAISSIDLQVLQSHLSTQAGAGVGAES